ncbi:hypothetical protein GQ53DRAFT_771614 [Thozetella sp. PMI_491]|nr:hypothetical protein GQ53DRAFT_771614 [Thozetella sp. PMI_491]
MANLAFSQAATTHGGSYPAGGGFSHDEDEDFRGAAEHASRHAGSSGDSDFFGSILNSVGHRKQQIAQEDIDEEEAVSHHKKFFGNDDEPDEATSGGMGSAAAVQALKLFTSGGGGKQSQSEFIGLAMSQASKLFDEQDSKGKVSSGSSKEGAVAQAAEVALKMYMKSQGGGSGGGMGSLLGLAGKFL